MMDKVDFGDEVVTPDEKTRRVGGVFTSVARSYDLMNDLMSGGMHRLWKDRFVARVKPRPGEQILDMAGGTGDVAFRMAARGARVTVGDINLDMLEVGVERARKRGIDGLVWQVENAEAMSFAGASFDAYTIAFGIRNVTDIPAALGQAKGYVAGAAGHVEDRLARPRLDPRHEPVFPPPVQPAGHQVVHHIVAPRDR